MTFLSLFFSLFFAFFSFLPHSQPFFRTAAAAHRASAGDRERAANLAEYVLRAVGVNDDMAARIAADR